MSDRSLSVSDLYNLAEQLELDRDLSVQALRARDHDLGARCPAGDDATRLAFWLDQVSGSGRGRAARVQGRFTESSAAALARVLAFAMGFAGMAGFLLGSGRGLVNIFVFLLLFVLLQLLLCLVAAWVMLRTMAGGAPAMLPVNPARWVVARSLPDARYVREAQSVLRLLLLRYGQELGALFTLGAMAGFILVLLLHPFSFVWGSTYQLSDGFVRSLTAFLALPWADWLPQGTVDAGVIAATRYHPAVVGFSPADLAAMGGWWPFLFLCMFSYALLPRLLLWLLSRYLFARQIRAAFTGMPGSELVLARMNTPLVQTQGEARRPAAVRPDDTAVDRGLLLLNWAGALAPGDRAHFDEFAAVAEDRVVNLGLGPAAEELARLQAHLSPPLECLCVAVKSWEPPMSDLADVLDPLDSSIRCTIYLVPLGDKPVSAGKLEDWQVFARGLGFRQVAVHPLGRA